ncbi:MAG: MBL fold metallo-hydrolase [Chitinophagales bacterium]|jgi:glyoxylase-like metal-dependent hydrolase (beta-lactamase superfamily II)|nr:MBL fold metallo-hydrolase [Chitinophagales bacterium]
MELKIIKTGNFKLDGGAMFGVVPRSMWSKLNPPDENNLCTWSMNSLLVIQDKRVILIDTGMGDKQDDKFRSHFYPHGDDNLLSSLSAHGVGIDEVTDVILTHLHFDHCGGAVYRDDLGKHHPQFPKAKYWTHSKHWDWAMHPNDREKASFLKENFEVLASENQLSFLDLENFDLSSVTFDFVQGHTEQLSVVNIDYRGQEVIFASDLMPSSYHIPMPYVMGYDIRPLDTLKEKEKLYQRVLKNQSILFFQHDPVYQAGRLKLDDRNRVVIDYRADLSEFIS